MKSRILRVLPYVLVVTLAYILIRSIAEKSMDGQWLSGEQWPRTIIEGLIAGVVLAYFYSGKPDNKMPD